MKGVALKPWSQQAPVDLSEQQFTQWSDLLEERTGMQIVKRQRPYLQAQILMRMRELQCGDYDHYYRSIAEGISGLKEWSVLVERLVVNETSFFRHRASIDFVRCYLQQNIDNNQGMKSFDVWSLGCSTGEEPYSLAMVINDCFELAVLEPYYGITATDISAKALTIARSACYGSRKLEQMSAQEIQRYMQPVDVLNPQGEFRVQDKLRDRVCFSQSNILNLKDMPVVKMDVIYCQNVLIYFRRWLRRDILNFLVERLKPGGILIVGLGEIIDWKNSLVKKVKNSEVQAYRRL